MYLHIILSLLENGGLIAKVQDFLDFFVPDVLAVADFDAALLETPLKPTHDLPVHLAGHAIVLLCRLAGNVMTAPSGTAALTSACLARMSQGSSLSNSVPLQ